VVITRAFVTGSSWVVADPAWETVVRVCVVWRQVGLAVDADVNVRMVPVE
jgi:hypothetical protein